MHAVDKIFNIVQIVQTWYQTQLEDLNAFEGTSFRKNVLRGLIAGKPHDIVYQDARMFGIGSETNSQNAFKVFCLNSFNAV